MRISYDDLRRLDLRRPSDQVVIQEVYSGFEALMFHSQSDHAVSSVSDRLRESVDYGVLGGV